MNFFKTISLDNVKKSNISKYWIQFLIIFLLTIIVSFLFPEGKALKYSYQLNDITREPIIAPFTFSIQKSKEKLKADVDEKKKLVPYVFNRDDSKVKSKTKDIDEFFSLVEKIIKANWSLEDSKNLVYERRYHKQYEKARVNLYQIALLYQYI